MNDQISSGSTKLPKHTGEQSDNGIEGERKILTVVERGGGKDDAAEHCPARSDEKAEENDGFKRDVGGEEIRNRESDPDAEGEGNEEEREQGKGLPGSAMLGEEKVPEGAGACKHAGYRCHHPEFHEQGDQNDPVGHPLNCIAPWRHAQMQTCGGSAVCRVSSRVKLVRCDVRRWLLSARQVEWNYGI